MKVTLWVFTGGSREYADEITSSVHPTLASAEAAEREWLSNNEDDKEEYPWFGTVEKVEVDITDANIGGVPG